MSKEQGFLGNICYPRVSQSLSRTLIEYDDGQQVNIPALIEFFNVSLSDKRASGRMF